MTGDGGAPTDAETVIDTGNSNPFDGKEVLVAGSTQPLTTEAYDQQRYEQQLKDAVKQKEAELAEKTGDVKYWLDNLDGDASNQTEPTPLTEKQQAAKDLAALNIARAGIRQMGQKK